MSEASLYKVVTWRIENYSGCWQDHNKCISSIEFSALPGDLGFVCLYLYPKGVSTKDWKSNDIGLTLEFSDDKKNPIKYDFEIINEKGLSENALCASFLFDVKYDTSNFLKYTFLNRSVLIKESEKYLPGDILTLCCKIWITDTISEVQRLLLRTRIPIEKQTFDWNFHGFLQLTGTSTEERYFKSAFGTQASYTFTLQYTPYRDDKYVKVKFSRSHGSNMPLYFKCELQTLLQDENFLIETGQFHTSQYEEIFTPSMSWRKISENSTKYLLDGTLKVSCKLTLVLRKVEHFPEELDILQLISGKEERFPGDKKVCDLKTDLLLLYQNKLMNDFSVKIGSKTIPTHSVILAARSPVFQTMLESNMKEKKDKILNIEDDLLDEQTMHKFLDYLYSDNPGELCVDSALKLFYAADKYQVPGLKIVSAEFLMMHINTSNVCEILLLADSHCDKELKISAIKFIAGHEKEVVISDKFKTFSRMNLELGVEVLLSLSEMKFK